MQCKANLNWWKTNLVNKDFLLHRLTTLRFVAQRRWGTSTYAEAVLEPQTRNPSTFVHFIWATRAHTKRPKSGLHFLHYTPALKSQHIMQEDWLNFLRKKIKLPHHPLSEKKHSGIEQYSSNINQQIYIPYINNKIQHHSTAKHH